MTKYVLFITTYITLYKLCNMLFFIVNN
uniref:Uncharacterized protein n=1 Tax=Anguilla anguilla TaxID=7936 RepID=A0A0E9RHG3_ANGAN